MPSNIVGLKYEPPYPKVETEPQLLEVFADLGIEFSRLNPQFGMFDSQGNAVCDFKRFLELSVKGEKVLLRGSGDLGGLVVKEARIEYDLSSMKEIVKFWDQYRDGSCYNCNNVKRKVVDEEDSRYVCAIGATPLSLRNCTKYAALRTNSEGKTARTLVEIMQESAA